jgi:hypothetical protein
MLALSDRAENLESIEGRLKQDILAEGAKFGGLALTHNEIGEAFAFNINYQPRSYCPTSPFYALFAHFPNIPSILHRIDMFQLHLNSDR